MKMRNEDLKKITEIKQHLLDPPTSFKLYEYAIIYIENAIAVLNKYPQAAPQLVYFENLLTLLKQRTVLQDGLRAELKKAGVEISRLTSK